MISDKLREEIIDGLIEAIQDPTLSLKECQLINDCARLLINNRSLEQVAMMEKKLFNEAEH